MEGIVAIIAVIGNSLVILVFYRERRLRRRTNYYIISLAFADFLVGLLGIPFALLVSRSTFLGNAHVTCQYINLILQADIGLPKNLHACLLTLSALIVLCTISIFCLVAVSIDRYWVYDIYDGLIMLHNYPITNSYVHISRMTAIKI